jgi:alpha-amylase
LNRFHLLLLIHSHQPVGNFDNVLELAYQRCYLPFVELLHRHPKIRVGLHYTGPLLEWFEKNHPEFFEQLGELVDREQVELVAGGFYEPILIAIPPEDRHEQLTRLADYIEKHFGQRPRGAWLAERVWEPQLPSTFAKAGVDYTLVDDIHFQSSGFELNQLHGYYVCEDLGATVKVIPGLKALRYLIPYRSPEENVEFLRTAAATHPDGFACMGDDNEKLGVWPGTYKHCYTDGWLERYFAALEENSEWLSLTLPGEYLAAHPPLGRADLPTASYTEMTEWALPTPVRQRFHGLQQEFANRPDVEAFLRGSFWRSFFTKYSEANLLHKKMLHVSAKVRRLASSARRGLPIRQAIEQATTHLLRAQCNDAYWHGIFGGIYAPHLRTVLWRELIHAEKMTDAAEHGRASYADLARLDFDGDGREEVYAISDAYAALVEPADGGTLAALDFRPSDVTLVNSMQRRLEPYHAKLRDATLHGGGGGGGVVSIHEQVRVKEEGLEKRLRYDRWPRNAFRLLLFSLGKTHADYDAVRLEESAAFAAGAYKLKRAKDERIDLTCEAALSDGTDARLTAQKKFTFSRGPNGFVLTCEVTLEAAASPASLQVGLESVVNLLAPLEPDRYFQYVGARHPLSWAEAVAASQLRLVDEWQNVAVALEAPDAREFWIAPIETVSESEEGFERVYQGSQILAVWSVELAPGRPWTGRVKWTVGPAR